MEDLLTFAAVFTVLITILLIVTSASLASFYSVADVQKRLVKNAKETDVVVMRIDLNAPTRTDKVVGISLDENNGILTLRNLGASDIFWVRVVCWDINDPGNTVRLIPGEQNGTVYTSIPFLSIRSPYDEVNYSVGEGNVCVLAGRRFIEGFVLRG